MIFFISFLVSFVVLALVFSVFSKKSLFKEPDRYGDVSVNPIGALKAVGVLVASLLIATLQPLDAELIDSGNVGLKINRVGNDKGVPQSIPVKGLVFYNKYFSTIQEFSVRQIPIKYAAFPVTTIGGFPVNVEPSFNYALKPEKAADLYNQVLKGNNLESLKDNWILTATRIAIDRATNQFTIDSIFNKKTEYQRLVEKELNEQMSDYFTVYQINPGIVPPPELAQVIKDKTEAIQKAQQAELDRLTAEADAARKIAVARGDSAQAVIKAAGEAIAVQQVQRVLSPVYVEYVKWANASKDVPRVPATVLGNNAATLLNLKQ